MSIITVITRSNNNKEWINFGFADNTPCWAIDERYNVVPIQYNDPKKEIILGGYQAVIIRGDGGEIDSGSLKFSIPDGKRAYLTIHASNEYDFVNEKKRYEKLDEKLKRCSIRYSLGDHPESNLPPHPVFSFACSIKGGNSEEIRSKFNELEDYLRNKTISTITMQILKNFLPLLIDMEGLSLVQTVNRKAYYEEIREDCLKFNPLTMSKELIEDAGYYGINLSELFNQDSHIEKFINAINDVEELMEFPNGGPLWMKDWYRRLRETIKIEVNKSNK